MVVIEKKKHLRDVLHECHNNVGHFSTRRTQENVSASYHWATLSEDVKKWVINASTVMYDCSDLEHAIPLKLFIYLTKILNKSNM